jgi:CRP-like cAMP-binding protein
VAIRQLQVVRPGERTNGAGKPVNNRILLAIPDNEYRSVRPHLEYLRLPHHRSLHEPHQRLRYVHFLNQGLISLVVVLKDGRTVEAGIVGNEGASGIAAAVGLTRAPLREIVQIAGDGFRVRVAGFQKVLQSTPQLRNILGRYIMVLGMQVAQTAACNRMHLVEQRLARWLLMAQDRVDSGTLPITHDFLATMLGTDRPSVTVAAGILQRLQLIGYRRGAVKILERMKLEKFACECYGIIRQYNGEL